MREQPHPDGLHRIPALIQPMYSALPLAVLGPDSGCSAALRVARRRALLSGVRIVVARLQSRHRIVTDSGH